MDEQIKQFALQVGFREGWKGSIVSPYVEDGDMSDIIEEYTNLVISETARVLLEDIINLLNTNKQVDPYTGCIESWHSEYNSYIDEHIALLKENFNLETHTELLEKNTND